MALEIKVPTVGESITEVVIGDWLKPEGAAVQLDEPVVALETDKVNVDVPAPGAGVVSRILKNKGETARVGEVIGYVDPAASASATPTQKAQPPRETQAAKSEGEPRIMPAAARVLGQAGQDGKGIQGTGPGGRVLKEDAVRALSEGQKIPLVYAEPPAPAPHAGAREAEPPTPKSASEASQQMVPAKVIMPGSGTTSDTLVPASQVPAAQPKPPTQPASAQASARREEVVAMTPLRKRVAQRLVEAQQTAAILTTFNEVDMSAIMDLRKKHQDDFVARHGVKLGFMSFFLKASVEALKAWPMVNAQIRGSDIVYQHFYDIGVAVGGGKGLVVPILRDADQLSFADIEKKLADFGARAKAGSLKLDELQGGTFSISNGGVYGSMMSTPILNPPQSGILGMHNIIERPIGVNGQVVLRPMMYLALSYDHRLVDGREAVSFLVALKKSLEAPERLLLGL